MELSKSVHACGSSVGRRERGERTNEIYSSMHAHEFPVDFDPTSGIYMYLCVFVCVTHKRGK